MPTPAFWQSTVNPQDLKDKISVAMRNGQKIDPIYQMIYYPTMKAKSVRHEWGEKALKANQSNVATAVASGDTTVTFTAADANTFDVFASLTNNKCYIQIDFEEMLVTAVSGNVATVTRAQKGTTAASHAVGATITSVNVHLEGADYVRNTYEGAFTAYNVTQIFRRDLQLSGTMQALKGLDGDNTLAKQLNEKDIQIMKDIAQACYLSNRLGSTNELERSMGGIRYYANKNSNALNLDKSFIEQQAIIPMLQGGADSENLVMVVGNALWSKITALKTNLVQSGGMGNKENAIEADIDRYTFGSAPLWLMRSPLIPNNQVGVFDRTRVRLLGVEGRVDIERPLAKTGDSDTVMKLSEMTMEVENGPQTAFWFSNVS